MIFRGGGRTAAWAALLLFGFSGTAVRAADETAPAASTQTAAKPAPKLPGTAIAATVKKYRTDFAGAPGKAVLDLMKKASQLVALKNRPPATVAALRRRVAEDESRFRDVLESQGYYDATVDGTLSQEGDTTVVKITVTPGEHFTIAALAFAIDRNVPSSPVLRDRLYNPPLEKVVGKPAKADDVIKAEDDAIAILRNHGFPFAMRGDRDTTVDHATHTVKVTLPVKLGPRAVFGATHFVGLKRLKEFPYMTRSIPWVAGQTFDYSKLEQLRKYFVDSGLFASAKVAPADTKETADDAPLDVNVVVVEGAEHTVSVGVNYGRDTGFGGNVDWTHRDLFGNGEKLDLNLTGTELDQTASATLSKPNFLRRNQTLTVSAQAEHSDTDAFTGWSGTTAVGLERKLGTDWIVGGGVSLEVADLTQNGVSSRSTLVGLPVTVQRAPLIATRSITQYFVDQTEGWRLTASATPYTGTYLGPVNFLSTEAEGDAYFPLDERKWDVLALRLKLGTIVGAGTDEIPPDHRFYSGGGGSVRGFAYQLVSPLAADNTPIGGRGLVESSVEMRVKVTDTIGIVPFIDTGAVSPTPLPGDRARFAFGAGVGARYYTNVGPLRVDVAVPLNPRGGIDSGFQFYLSFGQAF